MYFEETNGSWGTSTAYLHTLQKSQTVCMTGSWGDIQLLSGLFVCIVSCTALCWKQQYYACKCTVLVE